MRPECPCRRYATFTPLSAGFPCSQTWVICCNCGALQTVLRAEAPEPLTSNMCVHGLWVLLNNGVLDIWWVLGGQSVDINKIHYRNIRLLSTVYQCLGYTYEMSSLYLPIIWVYIYSLSNHHPHQTEQFPLTISSSTIYPAYDQSWVCISRLYPGKKLMVLKWMKYK